MCRLLYYCGKPIKLESLLINAPNSLFNQSLNNQRNKWFKLLPRDHMINCDGFGVAWLTNNDFCIYKNTCVPFHDKNIIELAKHIEAPLFVGHLRAVKNHKNCKVSRDNCHPFKWGKIVFMHNGLISHFKEYKQKIIALIDKKYHQYIEGTTDTECIFFYFLTLLNPTSDQYDCQHFVRTYLQLLHKLQTKFANSIISANIIITTPEFTVGSRFINDETQEPPSLYYNNTTISSEPLYKEGFRLIEKNMCFYVNHRTQEISFVKI